MTLRPHCDGCDQPFLGTGVKLWTKNPTSPFGTLVFNGMSTSSLETGLDFCNWKCVAEWARAKHRAKKADAESSKP